MRYVLMLSILSAGCSFITDFHPAGDGSAGAGGSGAGGAGTGGATGTGGTGAAGGAGGTGGTSGTGGIDAGVDAHGGCQQDSDWVDSFACTVDRCTSLAPCEPP